MAQDNSLIFEVRQEGVPVRTERIDRDAIKIGSHQKSHLHVEDPDVSRVHAVIERSPVGTFIIDLGSGRGTFVNGERVNKKQLSHRDTIRIGSTDIVFMTHDEKAAAAAAARRARAIDPKTKMPRDEVLYARRFLARPAQTDGTVEVAMLYRDYVMAEEIYKPPKNLVIGSSKVADFHVDHPSIGEDDFVLVEAGGGVYVGKERFTLKEALQSGKARRDGKAGVLALTDETRAKVVLGHVKFFLHRSTRPALVLPWQGRDAAPTFFMLFSLALHALLWLLIMFLPPGIGSLALDSFGAQDRFVQILIQDAEPEVEEEIADVEDEGEQEDQRAEDEEGEAGDEQAQDEEDLRMAVEGDADPNQPIELARADALEQIQDRGALAVLNQQGPTAVFGSTPSGYDAVMAIGATTGEGVGASYGTRGLGRYGGGLGGGGRNTRALGAGPVSLRGGRGGQDSDLGRSLRTVRERQARPPSVVPGRPNIEGQLDRDIIQRVIREHRREIRACYEAELQRTPELEGRVLINFVIAPDGQVAGSRSVESSLNNSTVEDCVVRRIRSWRFPEPRGGGTVNVNYPFVFTPTH